MKRTTIKILSVLLSVCMICVLFAGCGSDTLKLAEYPDGKPEFENIASLAGKRIAVTAGSVQEEEAQDAIQDPQFVYLENNATMIVALLSDKADAVIVSDTSYKQLLVEYPQIISQAQPISSSGNYFGIAKNERGATIQKQLNEYLAALGASGDLQKLLDNWHNSPDTQPDVNFADLPNVNGELALAGYIANAPYVHVGENGPRGIEVELLYGFCKAYGYAATFETPEFSGVLAGLTTGKYDIAGCLAYTEERAEKMYFADMYEDCTDVVVVRRVAE